MTPPLLDTHAWIWWMLRSPDLGREAQDVLDSLPAGQRPLLSAISLWEAATLVERGRLLITGSLPQWLRTAAGSRAVELVPITTDIAAESAALPPTFHRDPADRLIVATARVRGCSLLTRDERIIRSGLVQVWTP